MRGRRSRTHAEGLLPWPLATIDFEASSLAPDSYPIEVGVARWRSPAHPIETWSALVRPPKAWRSRHWSRASEAVHGITRERLDREGVDAGRVMAAMNALCGRQAFCDGAQSDLRWLGGMEDASGIEATFLLRDADALGAPLHPRHWRRMQRWLERARPRHRAGPDAERLLRGLAVGLAYSYGDSVVPATSSTHEHRGDRP